MLSTNGVDVDFVTQSMAIQANALCAVHPAEMRACLNLERGYRGLCYSWLSSLFSRECWLSGYLTSLFSPVCWLSGMLTSLFSRVCWLSDFFDLWVSGYLTFLIFGCLTISDFLIFGCLTISDFLIVGRLAYLASLMFECLSSGFFSF